MEALSPESEFTVKEATIVDLFIAAFFLFMFFSALIYGSGNKGLDGIMMISLVPGIAFLVRAFVKTVTIRINKVGIWFARQPVTTWKDFIAAKVNQLPMRTGGWEEREELAIEYYKGTEGDVYKKTIALLNTQNKSGEEIIAAIEYFYELYKVSAGKVA